MYYRELAGLKVSALGFGCMRFPVKDGHIDEAEAEKMLMRAYENGVNYFDTAYPYHNMESEPFVGRVFSRLPRESFYLATKFPVWKPSTYEESKEIFDFQLNNLKSGYVDFYLFHAINRERWERVNELGLVPLFEEYQKQGRIRKLGFSFHGPYEDFEEILRARKWDFCQIQLNYMDTDVQAGEKGMKLAEELGTGVVIMEPVKGGSLAALPKEVSAPLRAIAPDATDASWALRFVAIYENAKVILSGMSTMEQLEDNLATMNQYRPLSKAEKSAVDGVAETLRARTNNACTACRYCMPCPNGVDIPRMFRIWNEHGRYQNDREAAWLYSQTSEAERADKCVGCGVCEPQCPQGILIRKDLNKIACESWAKAK